MVYAMFIVFLLFLYIHTAYCQTTTTITSQNFIYNCSFSIDIYSTNEAVLNQFQFLNQTSVILTADYAFLSYLLNISTFEIGLIYPFSPTDYFVPFPIILNCASIVRSCQLKFMASTTLTSGDAEPINVPLTPFNYTSTSIQYNQMGLYLKEGQYQLSSCLLNDGQSITDNQTTFNIQIQYEKPVGTACIPSIDTCGSPLLTNCSSTSLTCTCLSSSSLVSYSNSFYCADTMNISNCNIFPTRCISWCNATTNNLCICPSDTLKIQRNSLYVCELPVDSLNCSINDTIRRCPYGQSCIDEQCMNDITTTIPTTTATATTNLNDSTNQQLRIALGVIAGLLGTSVIVLLGVFCWLRQKQKRRRKNEEKSFTPSSSTSSLYISPIQHQDYQSKKYPSINAIYQLPIENNMNNNNNKRFSPIYRTDSFCQAVLSGHQRPNQMIEHVSTKRDSFIRNSYYQNDFGVSPYSTLEFVLPSQTINNQNFDKTNNIYQAINPSSSPRILTHAV